MLRYPFICHPTGLSPPYDACGSLVRAYGSMSSQGGDIHLSGQHLSWPEGQMDTHRLMGNPQSKDICR